MTAAVYTLWRMSFQACILILIVLAARLLLKKYSSFYAKLLWLFVIVRLLCPVFIASNFSLLPTFPAMRTAQGMPEVLGKSALPDTLAMGFLAANQPADPSAQRTSADAAERQSFADGAAANISDRNGTSRMDAFSPVPPTGKAGTDNFDASPLLPQTGTPTRFPAFLKNLLPALSLAGTIATALIFLIQFLLLKRRISTAVCESGNIWLCENIASPFVIGILHPRIILPYRMPPEARAHVLSHEQTHIRHHDPLLHFAGLACLCLHWWNPFVWLAVHKMNQDMEMFCDESTLQLAAEAQRKNYAKTLLSFAEQGSRLHAGPAFGESNTERRVKNIMQKRKKSFLVLGLVVLLAIFCTAAFMTVPKTTGNEDEPNQGNIGTDKNLTGSGNDASGDRDGNAGNGSINVNATMPTKDIVFPLSEDDVFAWCRSTLFMPDFMGEADLDASFWKDYLFDCYSRNFDGEQINRYSKRRGMTTAYAKVSAQTLDCETRGLFGRALSEYVADPQDLSEEDGDIIYEDGYYYIRIPASDNYVFEEIEVNMKNGGKNTTLTFLTRSPYRAYPDLKTTLYLEAAENENGYLLTGKEELEYDFTNLTLTGSWLVTDYFIPSQTQTDEIEQFIGVQIKFGADYLMVGGQRYPVSEYRKESITAREFNERFQLSTGDDLLVAATHFDCYHLQTAQDVPPFGSLVYRYDFENAFLVSGGIIFRITMLAQDPEQETALDQLSDLRPASPDENGFVEYSLIPDKMLPGSIIYYTDARHYVIIEGGIAADTPEEIEQIRTQIKENVLCAALNGYQRLPLERPEPGECVTYDNDGCLFHVYLPHKMANAGFPWYYEDENYKVVVAGLHTKKPMLYSKWADNQWKAAPIQGAENVLGEDREQRAIKNIFIKSSQIYVDFENGEDGLLRYVNDYLNAKAAIWIGD